MPKFRVKMTATKEVEVDLIEGDLEHGETSLEHAAGSLASECAFRNGYPDMVRIVEDWDLTVEEIHPAR